MARKKPTAIQLIEDAAADPALTPGQALIALGRLAMHLGVHDSDKLKVIGPGLGHIAQGIAKVAAANTRAGDGDDEGALAAFVKPLRADAH